MPLRTGQARWNGDLKSGSGRLAFGSGAFEGPYSFASRFESGKGTNPEELIAAAHAGCFAMATAGALSRAGFSPESLAATATVHLESVSGGFKIARIDLEVEGDVPGIDQTKFAELAEGAKKGCPVSVALAAVPEITLTTRLRQKTLAGSAQAGWSDVATDLRSVRLCRQTTHLRHRRRTLRRGGERRAQLAQRRLESRALALAQTAQRLVNRALVETLFDTRRKPAPFGRELHEPHAPVGSACDALDQTRFFQTVEGT